jgi:hypothetical protein
VLVLTRPVGPSLTRNFYFWWNLATSVSDIVCLVHFLSSVYLFRVFPNGWTRFYLFFPYIGYNICILLGLFMSFFSIHIPFIFIIFALYSQFPFVLIYKFINKINHKFISFWLGNLLKRYKRYFYFLF